MSEELSEDGREEIDEWGPIHERDDVVKEWAYRNHKCIIRYIYQFGEGHYCGYTQLRPDEIVQIDDIDVHGGITYPISVETGEVSGEEGVFIGFDTDHAFSHEVTWNEETLTNEVQSMVDQINERGDDDE